VKKLNLTELKIGQTGKVVDMPDGNEFLKKIHSMGIIPGREIKKLGAIFGRGPQTVQVGATRIAIGYGMARKITVQVDE
jgi:ferrous iron transport protein A